MLTSWYKLFAFSRITRITSSRLGFDLLICTSEKLWLVVIFHSENRITR